jgi:hypothetical protein
MGAFLGFCNLCQLRESGGERPSPDPGDSSASPRAVATAARRPEHASEREPLRAPAAQGSPFPGPGWKVSASRLGGTRAGDDAEGRCGPETAVSTVLWRGAGAAHAGFPDPLKHPYTPSADMVRESEPKNRPHQGRARARLDRVPRRRPGRPGPPHSHEKGKKTVEVACLITSDRSADPATLAAWARGHWHIENKLHWVHDVTYQEDKSLVRTSNAPQVTATLRLSNQPSAPGGPRQHRGRQPAPRPRSAADAQATSGGMNDFAGSLSPWYCCRRWLSSASPPSTACSDRGSKLFITGNGSRGCGPTISTSRHGI